MGELSTANDVSITLNGKAKNVPPGTSVSELLELLDLRERLVVVERNASILNRSDYAEALIEDGDVIEIVHFVGGG